MEEAKTPAILDPAVIDDVVRVDDEPAYAMTMRLFREEALIVGPSTGAIVHAIAMLDPLDGPVVGVSPDGGQKYVSYFTEVSE
jgi:cysteine synthase